jgi:uncharacterized RDD family membrane protein YckC
MKCPKCSYLGFEDADRCRNCGYDFALSYTINLPELSIRAAGADDINPLDDLALVDSAVSRSAELPLFGSATGDDAPLITKASPPRPPLSVRRATPEVPRLRAEPRLSTPMLDLAGGDLEPDPLRALSPNGGAREEEWASWAEADSLSGTPAGLGARFVAAAIDLVVLAAIDVAVVYFTLQICGVPMGDFAIIPKAPLVAFLIVLNGGYFVAFTAGGQTLGKMATGIRVIPVESATSLDLPHSIVRTVVWVVLAIPAGLGLLTALFTRDRRGLHDRCAGTRVVRATA